MYAVFTMFRMNLEFSLLQFEFTCYATANIFYMPNILHNVETQAVLYRSMGLYSTLYKHW